MTLVEQFFESESSNRRIIRAIALSFKVDADALESDVLVGLMAQPDSVPFDAAIRTVARCRAHNLRKAESRQKRGNGRVESLEALTEGNTADDHDANIPEPSCDATIERQLVARAVLARLSPKMRRACIAGCRVSRQRARKILAQDVTR